MKLEYHFQSQLPCIGCPPALLNVSLTWLKIFQRKRVWNTFVMHRASTPLSTSEIRHLAPIGPRQRRSEVRGQSDRTGNSVKALLSSAEAVLDSANSRNYGSSLRHARDAGYREMQHLWHGQRGAGRCGALGGNLTRRCISGRVCRIPSPSFLYARRSRIRSCYNWMPHCSYTSSPQ